MSAKTVELVERLEVMDLRALRAFWAERYGDPPPLRSPGLLRCMLAWQLQVQDAGGVDPRLAEALRTRATVAPGPPAGAVLIREWKGVRHRAEVVEGGVLYQGRLFESLSSVAREITGARWNGPRFFGLRASGSA
ncbi:DUF2924 domain-containing protein [Caulobacter sp. S45]|uniref:DUF2924 domain-containing protein n=1 Tax=Caulobacter sp. S45 TaxID=1641861 RepID=UPI001C20B1E1|nr:DUF2924 domain-containing protein [Caulobacter sp. S45]